MRRRTRFTAIVVVAALGIGFAQPAKATESVPESAEIIELIAPEVFDGGIPSSGDVSATDLPRYAFPVAGGDDIVMGDDGLEVRIGLPHSVTAKDAGLQDRGVSTYESDDGFSIVPVIKEGGFLQIASVIDDAQAPERYDYPVTLPAGGSLELNPDGSVSAVDESGSIIGVMDVPWAKDSRGDRVPTRFEVDGNVLKQVVEHRGAAYPVVADPFWIPALRLVASWTSHALQQIAARNISQNLVRIAVQEGRRSAGNQAGTSVFTANGIRVVVNDKTGAIITVIRAGGGGGGGGV